MRKVQPHGPYYLGGYCFGGNVAFEMARQLLQQGNSVGLGATFSAPLRVNRPTGERAYSPERVPKIEKPAVRSTIGMLKGAVRWRAEKLFYSGRTILHK